MLVDEVLLCFDLDQIWVEGVVYDWEEYEFGIICIVVFILFLKGCLMGVFLVIIFIWCKSVEVLFDVCLVFFEVVMKIVVVVEDWQFLF